MTSSESLFTLNIDIDKDLLMFDLKLLLSLKLNVIDGDITDFRPLDNNNKTNIVGLHFKIVVNKDNAKKLDFCIA